MPNLSENQADYPGFTDGATGKEPTCQHRRCKRCEFDPWVGKNALKKEIDTHTSILAWEIPWTGGVWWVTVHGVVMRRARLSSHTGTHTNTHKLIITQLITYPQVFRKYIKSIFTGNYLFTLFI